MTTHESRAELALRYGFRSFNRLMLLNWRLGLGSQLSSWPKVLGRYMVLVHTGRKSGMRRFTPLNYTEVNGEIYCVAGFGAVSDWYKNISARPIVEIWLPNGRWAAQVNELAGDAPEWLPLLRAVLKDSGFAAILAGANPYTLSDADLARICASYRLIRLERHEPVQGPGGPGDLAWIWPLVVAMGVLLAWARAGMLRK